METPIHLQRALEFLAHAGAQFHLQNCGDLVLVTRARGPNGCFYPSRYHFLEGGRLLELAIIDAATDLDRRQRLQCSYGLGIDMIAAGKIKLGDFVFSDFDGRAIEAITASPPAAEPAKVESWRDRPPLL